MDQQNNRAVPRPIEQNGEPQPAPDATGRVGGAEGRSGAANQWEVLPAGRGTAQAPSGWETPRITEGTAPEDRRGTGSAPGSGWGTTAEPPRAGTPAPGWGTTRAPAQEGQSGGAEGRVRPARRSLIIGGVAVAVAAAAGAGAYAASHSQAAAADNTPGVGGTDGQAGAGGQLVPGGQPGMAAPDGSTGGMDGGGMAGPGGLGMGMGGLNAAIHSEYVVLQDSSYVTMASQTGTVTSVSSDSLTVKSDDGFSRTYAVTADVQVSQGTRQRGAGSTGTSLGLPAVTSGATARVTALKESDTYTAQSILIPATGSTGAQGSGTTTN
ncbi:hypothetical protein JHV56_17500 [Arthrobacter sp. BHU FT2]|nr:hypothetical protein [Arthrobacter sp. BHU FT2]